MKNRVILIFIITVICGLAAGLVSFYQQQKTSQTVSVDIISTIVPTEQEKPVGITVDIDSLRYNQTLSAVLNNKNSSTSWEADLNSAVLHTQTQIKNQKKAGLIPAELVNTAQKNADSLNAKHYNNTISSKISLLSFSSLSSPSSPNSPYYPYLITLLGLLVGYCLGLVLIRKQI